MDLYIEDQLSEKHLRDRRRALLARKMEKEDKNFFNNTKAIMYADFRIQQQEIFDLTEQKEDLLEENQQLKKQQAIGWNQAVELSKERDALVKELKNLKDDLQKKRERTLEMWDIEDDRKKTKIDLE